MMILALDKVFAVDIRCCLKTTANTPARRMTTFSLLILIYSINNIYEYLWTEAKMLYLLLSFHMLTT